MLVIANSGLAATFEKIAYVLACLAIPIVWGWLVNVVFDRLNASRSNNDDDDDQPPLVDYQI